MCLIYAGLPTFEPTCGCPPPPYTTGLSSATPQHFIGSLVRVQIRRASRAVGWRRPTACCAGSRRVRVDAGWWRDGSRLWSVLQDLHTLCARCFLRISQTARCRQLARAWRARQRQLPSFSVAPCRLWPKSRFEGMTAYGAKLPFTACLLLLGVEPTCRAGVQTSQLTQRGHQTVRSLAYLVLSISAKLTFGDRFR
jgi:hypothetical protein